MFWGRRGLYCSCLLYYMILLVCCALLPISEMRSYTPENQQTKTAPKITTDFSGTRAPVFLTPEREVWWLWAFPFARFRWRQGPSFIFDRTFSVEVLQSDMNVSNDLGAKLTT